MDIYRSTQEQAMIDYEESIFEKLYDEHGLVAAVPCDECDYSYVVYIDGEYICPTCGKVVSRKYVFDWLGVTVWPECVDRCCENFGNCFSCKYGHLDE